MLSASYYECSFTRPVRQEPLPLDAERGPAQIVVRRAVAVAIDRRRRHAPALHFTIGAVGHVPPKGVSTPEPAVLAAANVRLTEGREKSSKTGTMCAPNLLTLNSVTSDFLSQLT